MQSGESFIPEALEGLIRFVIFLILFAGSVLALVWRILTRPITEDIRLIKETLGGKEAKPRLDILERDMLIMQNDVKGLTGAYEKHEEVLDQMKLTTQRIDQTLAVLTERIDGKLELLIERASNRRKDDPK